MNFRDTTLVGRGIAFRGLPFSGPAQFGRLQETIVCPTFAERNADRKEHR